MKYIFLTITLILLGLPVMAQAAILPPCTATGNCGVCDMMFTINAIMRWITFVAGSLALLLFVWGGVMFLTSAGRSEKITKAKDILKNTLIGAVLVFVAWTFVNLVITSIAGKQEVLLYTEPQAEKWYNLCVGGSNECVGKGDGYPCNERNGHCEGGQCESGSACEWLNDQPGYEQYACRNFTDCGLKSYEECDTASNCIKNLCPGGAEEVCCFPK